MPPREPRRGRFTPEAEVGPASGGHLTPDVEGSGSVGGPMFEALSEREPRPTEPIASTRVAARQTPKPVTRKPVRRRIPVRRVKRTLKHVDPFSVLKLSLLYYACLLPIWFLFVAMIYWLLAGFELGNDTTILEMVEQVQDAFVLESTIDITLWTFEKWALLIGLTFVVLGSLVNMFLAVIHNLAADIVGGIEMTFVERDQGASAPPESRPPL